MEGKSNDKVGPQEICILIVFVALSHLLWPKNNRLYDTPGHSVWISALLAGGLGVLLVLVVMRYTRGKGLAGALCESYGDGLGSVFALAFAIYFLLMVAALLGRSESEMAYFDYTATDKTIIRVVFGLAMTFIACCGIAGVSRTARFAIIILVCCGALMLLFSLKRLDFVRIYPLLGQGALAVGRAALDITGGYWSVFVVAGLGLHVGRDKKLGSGAIWGVAVSALCFAGIFLLISSSLSSKAYEQAVSPVLFFVSVLRAGKFINRVDALFICAWVSLAVIAGAFGIQGSAHLMARATGTSTTKPFCIGIGGLIIVMSSQMQTQTSITEVLKLAWIPAVAVVLLGMAISNKRKTHE